MGEDPRIPVIRRAFEEAHFDERTPDEKGFAEVFESFKPKLIENIERNLKAVTGRKKTNWRLGLAGLGCGSMVVAVNVLVVMNATSELGQKIVFGLAVFAGIAVFALPLWSKQFAAILEFFDGSASAQQRDPNNWPMLEAVLARFDCKLGFLLSFRDRAIKSAPIRPPWSDIWVNSATVEGTFDGHLKFVAARVRAWKELGEGKKAVTFLGWHIIVDLPFSFSGTTVVRDRQASYMHEKGPALTELRLEDPEFTRRFIAQTDDQIEARVIFSPDVIHHVASSAASLDRGGGRLMMAFSGSKAHIWLPWKETALSDWQPLHPPKLIQDLHEAFAEMAEIRAFLRDIDVIAESEGFRAQAARNARAS